MKTLFLAIVLLFGATLAADARAAEVHLTLDGVPVDDVLAVSGGGVDIPLVGTGASRRPGSARYSHLCLKRGTTKSKAFFVWIAGAVNREVKRMGGKISLRVSGDAGGEVLAALYEAVPIGYETGVDLDPRGEPIPYEQLTLRVRQARYQGSALLEKLPAPDALLGAFDADGDGVANDLGWTLLDAVDARERVVGRRFLPERDPGPFLLLEGGAHGSTAETFAWLDAVLDALQQHDTEALDALRSGGVNAYTYSDASGHVVRTVSFFGGLPARYEGPRFDAESGQLAASALEIRVDRIEMK